MKAKAVLGLIYLIGCAAGAFSGCFVTFWIMTAKTPEKPEQQQTNELRSALDRTGVVVERHPEKGQ